MGKYSELTTFTEGIVQFSKQLGEPPSFSLTKLEDGIATVSDNVPAAADSSRSLIDKKLMPISEETKSSAAEVLGNKVPNNQCKLFTLSYTTYSSSDSNDNYWLKLISYWLIIAVKLMLNQSLLSLCI